MTVEETRHRWYPRTTGGVFYLLVLLGVVGGITTAALIDWRFGVRLLASALSVAALLRLVIPNEQAGMLAVRHRAIDVGLLTAVALGLFLLTSQIDDLPPQ